MSGPFDWKPTTNIERAAEVIWATHLLGSQASTDVAEALAAEGLLKTEEDQHWIALGRAVESIPVKLTPAYGDDDLALSHRTGWNAHRSAIYIEAGRQ